MIYMLTKFNLNKNQSQIPRIDNINIEIFLWSSYNFLKLMLLSVHYWSLISRYNIAVFLLHLKMCTWRTTCDTIQLQLEAFLGCKLIFSMTRFCALDWPIRHNLIYVCDSLGSQSTTSWILNDEIQSKTK